jgi:hypothetical protein
MRRSIAALSLAAVVLSGCPLFRSSSSPQDACDKAALIMDRCATAESPKWDQTKKDTCVATLRTFAATPEGKDGYLASLLRDCDAAVNQPAPTCPEQVTCVNARLAEINKGARAPGK